MSGESVDPFALVVAPIGLEPRRVATMRMVVPGSSPGHPTSEGIFEDQSL